jgi:hypothetical protein
MTVAKEISVHVSINSTHSPSSSPGLSGDLDQEGTGCGSLSEVAGTRPAMTSREVLRENDREPLSHPVR